MTRVSWIRRCALLAARCAVPVIAAAAASACSDALDQGTTAGQVVAVVNRDARSLSLIDATRLDVASVVLSAAGAPATIAAGDSVLLVPLGDADSARIVSYTDSSRTVALPAGSGATGAAVQDDATGWVANPNRNSVTRVDLRTGDTASFAVGPHPQAVLFMAGVLFVVNSNAPGGVPAGPSSLTWIAAAGEPHQTTGTIPLSCTNARFVAPGDDDLMYVVCAGTAGAADGRLSIVDPVGRRELVIINGLGESPGPAAHHPTGRLLVAAPAEGILEVNTLTRAITRGPGAAITPGGDGIAAVAVDQHGRVWAVAHRGCGSAAGVVHVLRPPPDYREVRLVPVGSCPVAAAVAVLPRIR